MKETWYFPHDYNASQDVKILALKYKCGISGVGIYWTLIELLHQQPDGKIPKSVFTGVVEKELDDGCNGVDQVANMCSALVQTGLLQTDEKFVWSSRVMNNKNHREQVSAQRRIAGKMSAAKRVGTNVQRTGEQVLNNIKERKGKNKEIQQHGVRFGEFVRMTQEQYDDLIKLWGKADTDGLIQEMNDYIGANGRKYRSHYHALRTWRKRRFPDERPRRML